MSAGARWQVDGGAWQNSGVAVSGLSVGSHTVSFSSVAGWNTPGSQNVSISNHSTTTTTGTYMAQPGSLQVTINPASAVSAGAQWQVDGGAWQNSGVTVTNLSVGSHTVSFSSVAGWNTPGSQNITITNNSTTMSSGTYTAQPGSLQVTISPAGAVSAGAQWQVDGGAWQNSGVTVTNLSVGGHTVSFRLVGGWNTPSSQNITITSNSTTTASGTYTAQPGSLQVTISPAGAVSAGAQWQVDGGAWQTNGAMVSGLSATNHTVAFSTVSGWTTPANQTIAIKAGQTTNTVGTYVAAQTAVITLSVSPTGAGTVTGAGTFKTGSSRTVKATPGSGYLFADWTEGSAVVSSSAAYAFTLNADRNLVANFIPNPFIPVKGTYNGLFYEAGGVLHQSSGCFTLATTVKGTFSGSLIAGGTRYSLSGQLDANGDAQVTVARRNLSSLTVVLHLDLTQGTDQTTGTVSDGTWTTALSGDRAVYDGKTSIAPLAGNKYTLILPGSNDSTTEPGGDGYGTLTVDGTGKIHLAGSLSDGTKLSQVGALSKNGEWPFYVPLYSGQGSVLSWIAFTSTATNDLSGDLTWTKPGMASAKYYPGGFRVETAAWGSLYSPPATGQQVLNFSEGEVVLSGGNLTQGITNYIGLSPVNKVTSTNKTSLTFTLPTGLFKGSVTNANPKTIPFNGVVLQKQNLGCGYFLGTNLSGRVWLQGP